MTITLALDKAAAAGITLKLDKLGVTIKKLAISLEWGAPMFGSRADLDLLVVKHDENGARAESHITSYATALTTAGVQIMKDVTTGDAEPEKAFITFDETEPTINEISLWAMVYNRDADKAGHTFGNIRKGKVTLSNQETGEIIAQYELGSYGDTDTLRIGDFYYSDGNWKFRPVAEAGCFGQDSLCFVLRNLGFAA